ncbi:DMT family transporter [Flavobacteriaceae bacterium F08102]|nr:DMT family transporter [Flavobacteriaceae bacterium F08102]
MSSKNIALLAAFVVAIIYGVSYTVAKEVMPMYIKPYGLIVIRVLGACIVFWGLSLFMEKKRIEQKDIPRLMLAALFGVGINMLSFYKGLSMTTPINAAVLMLSTPIIVLILAALILKERITPLKFIGVFIGLIGAVLLIAYGQGLSAERSTFKGDLLVFINATSYGGYLIVIKKLTNKYPAVSLIKWLYLFGLIIVLPFGFNEFLDVQWSEMPASIYLRVAFIVVFTTVCTYLFNLFALKQLKPTTLSSFIYLQPVIATGYALFVGSDTLNPTKIVATLLIFLGVYLVTKSNSTLRVQKA